MGKIELLAPAGSMANLKAAVSRGADAIYLGMQRFSARDFATNFNEKYLSEAIKICRSNNVKTYLTMNTLIKNNEITDFFRQLSAAYSKGIDSVIIQEISLIDIVKKNYPDLKVHISTQAGVMNSEHSKLLGNADRITLARELKKEEICKIRTSFQKGLEIFCHGALCASISGQCLFSSLLGGRSGNRGRCAQPCRKRYNGGYYLSTKELCLIRQIPEIIGLKIDAIKIEGRMRTPYYVAAATEAYRKAIDSFYKGKFIIPKETITKLQGAFSREFTEGIFKNSHDIFNRNKATGTIKEHKKEFYEVNTKDVKVGRKNIIPKLPEIERKRNNTKQLIVRAYNIKDAVEADASRADIIYFDILNPGFCEVKKRIGCRLFGAIPRIITDDDIEDIKRVIKEKKPDGILAGNLAVLNLNLKIPIHLDYNINCFNDIDIRYFTKRDALPIISPELSMNEMNKFRNKNFIVLVHGKVKLMTLRHKLEEGWIKDEKGGFFEIKKIHNGTEIINKKELGLFSQSSHLIQNGIRNFLIDSEKNVGKITAIYRKVLDGKDISDRRLRKKYILAWSCRGVK